jgi:enediyne biosynthesis protein E4
MHFSRRRLHFPSRRLAPGLRAFRLLIFRLRTYPLIILSAVFLLSPGCDNHKDQTLFTQLGQDQTGINFQNTLYDGESLNVLNYIYFYNGGGVAIGDINNDGLPDILFTGNMVHNRLFLNKGNFTFEDITEKSGVAAQQGWCTGATMVDINGDGKMDIYICRSADANPAQRRNLLFINNGDLTFTEKAAEYGLADEGFSTQAAFFDYDKDGDLDMFLINHSLHQFATGAVDNPGWRKESRPAFECKLYRNDWSDSLHHAVFTDVSAQAGIRSDVLTFGLGLTISDLNNDGWPDIYVSNDFNEPDYLFMNNGRSATGQPATGHSATGHSAPAPGEVTFTEKLSACMDQTSLYSMGNDAADFNNDGLVDLMTLDMLPEDNHTQKMHSGAENFNKFQQLFHRGFYYQYSRNMLQKNNGDGTFSEIGQLAGVSNTDWSWSPLFCDFDNDGNKDLLVTNGYVKDYTDMDFLKYSADNAIRSNGGDKDESVKGAIDKMPSSPGTSYLFHNNGDNTFSRMNDTWGLTQKTVSSGAAYVDLDNDGAMDLVINNTNTLAGIYKNNSRSTGKGHYLKVALLGDPKNSTGIGSKVKLFCHDSLQRSVLFYQEAFPVRGFQSSVDPVLNFGVGERLVVDSVLVIWPNDKYQVLRQVKTDQTLKIPIKDAAGVWDYKTGGPAAAGPRPTPATPQPYFIASPAPGPSFIQDNYNDFDIQPLLLNYLSRRGPVMAKADVNHDGREDLFIGGSKGHPAQLFLQSANGTLIPSKQPAFDKDDASEDGAAEFFDANGDGNPDLFIAGGGYESPENDSILQGRLYLNDGKGHFTRAEGAIPRLTLSAGCVKAADINGDGYPDLFIGGRVVPGKYPLSPGSRILLNDGKGHFTDATARLAPDLANLGMVTDAVWIDLNNDHQPDLVVVGEWMPVRVFLNHGGRLDDASARYIRFPSTGWWNRIVAADLDGDGDLDLVLGNQGLNNQFHASEQQPLTLYYKDFNHNGAIDPIFCYYIQGKSYPAASRDDLTGVIPSLKKKFLEYHTYADATINDLFTADQLKEAGPLKAEILRSVWLENRGDSGFLVRELPQEAQYGPVYAIMAEDIDGDGKTDLVLAGGNEWTRIRFGRYRANHGTLLLNGGKGDFRYIPQFRSGLNLREDVRGVLDLRSTGGNLPGSTPAGAKPLGLPPSGAPGPRRDNLLFFGVNDGPGYLFRVVHN